MQEALKEVSTDELVAELANRSEVKKISVGPYQPYELRDKYSNRGSIEAETVLVIRPTNHFEA